MRRIHALCAGLLLSVATTADAALTYVNSDGAPVPAPAVFDASKDAIYFSESIDGAGNGQYTVTNNSVDYTLFAFGISNFNTAPWVGSVGNDFDCGGNDMNNWCYESFVVDSSNWEIMTGSSGDFSDVLDPGDNMLNFYVALDGAMGPGSSWDQFLYTPGVLASQLFVVLNGPSGMIYGSGGQPINPIPVPAAVWLMASGLIGLVGVARRRSKV